MFVVDSWFVKDWEGLEWMGDDLIGVYVKCVDLKARLSSCRNLNGMLSFGGNSLYEEFLSDLGKLPGSSLASMYAAVYLHSFIHPFVHGSELAGNGLGGQVPDSFAKFPLTTLYDLCFVCVARMAVFHCLICALSKALTSCCLVAISATMA